MIDRHIAGLLKATPEFADRYMALVESADDDPGLAVVLTDLADFVSELAEQVERSQPQLEKCLVAVEQLAQAEPEDEDLVVWAFLDSISPDHLELLRPWLGTRTKQLASELEFGPQ